jgi:hypothetical protein
MKPGFAMVFLLGAGVAEAQTMRPFTTFRQLHGETRLAAKLEYAAGILKVAPARSGRLYRMDVTYDQARFLPVSDYDGSTGSVQLGLRPAGEGGVRVVSRHQLRQLAEVAFSPRVDLALDLTLGAAQADVDLGGLRVNNLAVKCGASRTVVRFSQPNAVSCQRAVITAGAAEVSALQLGNSRCEEIEFEGRMGKVLLDFSGTWSTSSRAQVNMAVGELTLRLPRDVGVRITMDKFLASFDPSGLARRGNEFVTPGYERAQRRLDIDLSTTMGGVNVEWAGR